MRAAEIEHPAARSPGRGVTAVLGLLVMALLALGVLRLGGIDGDRFTVALLSLTPYASVYGLLVTLLCLLARRRLLVLLALAMTGSLAAMLLPRALADGDQRTDGQRVRVMSANLLNGRADPATVVRLARDARVDVLALQELTPRAVAALDEAGLFALLPYRVLRDEPGGSGSGVLARVPLRQIVLVEDSTLEQAAAVVDLSGAHDLEVLSVHLLPGVIDPAARHVWEREMAALPGPGDRPRVLAGDFNATLDHGAFNRLLDRGYADAAELTGDGLRHTWSSYPYGPPVTIDHVVVDRRVKATEVAVYDLPGSDHNAVLAELALPR